MKKLSALQAKYGLDTPDESDAVMAMWRALGDRFKDPGPGASDIERGVQQVTGMKPGLHRGSILPFATDEKGANHLAAPQFVYDLAKAFVGPGTAMRGGNVSDEDVLNMALNFTGGGLGASHVAGPAVRGGEHVLGMGVKPKYTVIHGGTDFVDINPAKFGSGEPGGIRPLGKGLYGGLARSPEELQSAVELARVYANKYGKGTPTLHAFEADLPAEKVSKLGYSSERLPSGDQKYWTRTGEGPADWEAEALPWRHAEDAPTAIEISVANTDRLKRAGKWPADTSYEDILAALSAPGPAAQDLAAKYGLPEFTTDLTPAQIEANRAKFLEGNAPDVPRRVYHGTGTPTAIDIFDGYRGSAGHFAFEPKAAEGWLTGEYNDEMLDYDRYSPNVVPAHVSAKNVFDVRKDEHSKLVPALHKLKKAKHISYEDLEQHVNDIYKQGFDSYFDFEQSHHSAPTGIAIKTPNQIKSTMNRGTFDPNDPHISKARGGLVSKYDLD